MLTLAFVGFMAFLIKFSEKRWWLCWFTVMGVAVQCGVRINIISLAISIGISQVLKDLVCGVGGDL